MWMAEFCRRAGLTRDAVRFYVRLGLLNPSVDGGNRYQCFEDADVERVALVRTAQQLGFTLRQIVALSREFDAGGLNARRKLALMREQLAMLDAQAARLRAMREYVRAKIAWIENGEQGRPPFYRAAGMRSQDSARQPKAMRTAARRREPRGVSSR